jgi:hypothetical protein
MKKNHQAPALLCGLLIALAAVPSVSAQEDEPDYLFPAFLHHLAKRHEQLKNLAMPDVEIRTAPGFEDEALYLLKFKTAEDVPVFIAALKEEDIPYLSFPNNELQVALFYTDMVKFIWIDVLGF